MSERLLPQTWVGVFALHSNLQAVWPCIATCTWSHLSCPDQAVSPSHYDCIIGWGNLNTQSLFMIASGKIRWGPTSCHTLVLHGGMVRTWVGTHAQVARLFDTTTYTWKKTKKKQGRIKSHFPGFHHHKIRGPESGSLGVMCGAHLGPIYDDPNY